MAAPSGSVGNVCAPKAARILLGRARRGCGSLLLFLNQNGGNFAAQRVNKMDCLRMP